MKLVKRNIGSLKEGKIKHLLNQEMFRLQQRLEGV